MAATLVVALVLGACTRADDDPGTTASTTTEAAPTTEVAAPVDGTAVLASVGPAVALVETPAGSGTAVLLADGTLVTNAHVVDPFGQATVTFGEDEGEVLDVQGVDLVADIAVLGPVPEGRTGVAMEDAADIEPGSDLYLVGYPGDAADPEVTISRGVLSRRRTAEGWDLGFLQTDAAISGGQSGGAVVDSLGRVVGISGLAYDEQYALALVGEDVRASVEAIAAGDGSDWTSLPPPEEATTTTTEVALDGGVGLGLLYVPEAPDGTLTIEADDAAVVQVTDTTLYPVAVNEAAADGGAVDPSGDPLFDADLPEPTPAAAPGTWTFTVPDDEPLLVYVDSIDPDAAAVTVVASTAFALVSPWDDPREIAVGDEATGVVTALGEFDTFFLDLEAGEEVTITASSATGDVAFAAYRPDDPEVPVAEADDGGGGLLDLDATARFVAEEAGTYGIDVYQVDGYSTAYRLTVTA